MATAGPKERAGLREPPVQKTPAGWMLEVGARDEMGDEGPGKKRIGVGQAERWVKTHQRARR